MECDFKETAVAHVSREAYASLRDDSGYAEYIAERLSSELGERIMGILDREEEIILSQSELRVSEYMPTSSVEYRRQINWSPLVRCKDCKHHEYEEPGMIYCPNWVGGWVGEDFFCKAGERREDGEA